MQNEIKGRNVYYEKFKIVKDSLKHLKEHFIPNISHSYLRIFLFLRRSMIRKKRIYMPNKNDKYVLLTFYL